jgi:hypothetical protein
MAYTGVRVPGAHMNLFDEIEEVIRTVPAAEIVYESDRAIVWQGDARDALAGVEKESTHLIVTDPPYGVEWQSNTRAQRFDQLVGDGSREDEREIVRGSPRALRSSCRAEPSPLCLRADRRARGAEGFRGGRAGLGQRRSGVG